MVAGRFWIGFGGSFALDEIRPLRGSRSPLLAPVIGPKQPRKQGDPSNHDFWYPPHIGPWNQNFKLGSSGTIVFAFFASGSHAITMDPNKYIPSAQGFRKSLVSGVVSPAISSYEVP